MLMTVGLNVGAVPFRNHYGLQKGSQMESIVNALVEGGLMARLPVKGPLYRVTDQGLRIASEWKRDEKRTFMLVDEVRLLGSDLRPVDSLPFAWRYRRSEAQALARNTRRAGRGLDIVHEVQMDGTL